VGGFGAGAVEIIVEEGRFVEGKIGGDGLLVDEAGNVVLGEVGLGRADIIGSLKGL
jgi:hypothetical protein